MLNQGAGGLCALFAPIASFERIGLAISGGPDSLALMLLYAAWAPEGRKPEAIVYSVDHGLRPHSADEVRSAATIAERLGLPARLLAWEGPKPATGVQAAARKARYKLIAGAMLADGVEVLLTAHHKDDQAETILMRLAHGSGARGLVGMQADAMVEGARVMRPLLGCSKPELAAVVTAHGLEGAVDPSNSDPAYERVRWRGALEALAPLGLDADSLAKFSARMMRLDALAARLTDEFVASHLRLDAFGVMHLPRMPLAIADEEVRIRVLLAVLRHVGGGQPERLEAAESLARVLAESDGVSRTLMGARIIASESDVVVFREAGRMEASSLLLEEDESRVFDGRFIVRAHRPGLTLGPAAGIGRGALERWLGQPVLVPMAAVATAPAIRDGQGDLLAVGCETRDEGVSVVATLHRSNR